MVADNKNLLYFIFHKPWELVEIFCNSSCLSTMTMINAVLFLLGTSHCQDLSSVKDSDIDELKAAKNKAKELIAAWLNEWLCTNND